MELLQIDVIGFDHNFSYILIGEKDGDQYKGVIIDPTGDLYKINKVLEEKKIKLVAQLITHEHPDHIELVDYFLEKKVPLKKFDDFKKDPEFEIAGINFKVLFTPGHTPEGVCFLVDGGNLITGDTIFCKGIGTTAYGGDEKVLSDTLDYLYTLDQDLIIWPGHNYGGASCSLGEALSFYHKKPDEKILEEIKKRVEEYEKNNKSKF